MDGASAGAFTVESSSAAILGPTVAERFITTPPLCMEIIADSLPRVADSERAGLRVAGMARPPVADMQVTDMRAHLEATLGRPTASPAIAELPLIGVLQGTEPTRATGDSPAATELSLDVEQAHRGPVVLAAAGAARRADSRRVEVPAVRTVAETLAADMPAVEVTAAADTEAGDSCSV
jgi:hypothetical protein